MPSTAEDPLHEPLSAPAVHAAGRAGMGMAARDPWPCRTRETTCARRITFSRRAALALAALPLAAPRAQGSRLEALFAPRARLWERWTAHAPSATVAIDHRPWARFLAAHLRPGADGVTRVAYRAVAPADREALEAYAAALQAVAVSRLSRAEQFAFWVNLYNALTILVVLRHYPVGSIRDINISPGLFASGPWGAKLATVEGEAITLNDIEHRILRPIWRDPRIHYAVNCASIGCPDLMRDPFTAANAEALLEAGARAFVNHPRGVSVTAEGLRVSSIYSWFAEDFGGEAGVVAHLLRYAAPPLAARIRGARGIAAHAYDWRLNDAP